VANLIVRYSGISVYPIRGYERALVASLGFGRNRDLQARLRAQWLLEDDAQVA